MITSLSAQISDWKYGRGIILKFISELSDENLDKSFPRKKLNTIRLQVEELAQIQSNYVDALTTRKIGFECVPLKDKSKQGLKAVMAELDQRLEAALESFNGNETIDWFGEQKNIHEHISAMIGHEQMHIGQIVAFCYAIGNCSAISGNMPETKAARPLCSLVGNCIAISTCIRCESGEAAFLCCRNRYSGEHYK